MNILLINHYAGSVKYGMEYRPYYLSREWVGLGHRVTIVAASQSHVRSRSPDLSGAVTEEMIDGIRYLWLRTPTYRGNGIRRAWNMLSFVRTLGRIGRRLSRECRPDVVIASSTYPLDAIPAARIARLAGARLVHEVHDLWPLSPIELGGMSRRHPFIMLMQWAEDYAYRKADRVVSMLPNAFEYMCGRGMAGHKFAYVPNGIDVAEWQGGIPLPQEHLQALERLRREGRFVVGYVGAHGLANALPSLLDAAERLASHPVAVVLVGQGPEKEALRRRAEERALSNVVLLPPVPKAAIPTLLPALDALYIGLQRTPLFRFGISPNKLMDYMMAGRPVIQAIEAGNDLVTESGCGITIPPEDPEAAAGAILRLMELTAPERAAMGARGQKYVLAHHDYRVLARRFLEAVGYPARQSQLEDAALSPAPR